MWFISSRICFRIIILYILTLSIFLLSKLYLSEKTSGKSFYGLANFMNWNFNKENFQPTLLSGSQKNFQSKHWISQQETSTHDIDDGIVCNVPKLNPWDPLIIDLISHERLLWCMQVQENMTYIDMDGYLRINESGTYFLKTFNVSYTCRYKTFDRSPGSVDNDISYSKELILTEPVKLKEDLVDVTCSTEEQGEFYHNIHAHPAERNNNTFGHPNEKQLTLLLFYLDSVAYSVMQRHLAETYSYTKNKMKMIYLEAFNKIADNSFPNLIPMLTGRRAYDEQEGMMKEFNETLLNSTFDSWPLIWKDFAAKGYATMFSEDTPQYGLFHYSAKGFAKKPVDFYYRMFWIALRLAESKNDTHYCFRNELKPKIMLDIVKRHLVTMSDKLQFLFTIHSELGHDYGSEIERYDDHLKEFWKDMFENGYLNKTVVIFASDHGHRYSAVRSTLIGLLEERLPFYGIYFPAWFYKLHPKIKENLKYNSKILSSTFDIHETLRDILDGNYDGTQRSLNNRGLSQLYPLPKNRTCAGAGIPDHYCTCIHEAPLSTSLPEAKRAAAYFIIHLNSLLTTVTHLCHDLSLKKILFFRKLDHDEKLKQGVKSYHHARLVDAKLKNGTRYAYNEMNYRIGVMCEPFDSSFEAAIKFGLDKELSVVEWYIDGNSISRINAYGNTSECVSDKMLKKYCACKIETLPSS